MKRIAPSKNFRSNLYPFNNEHVRQILSDVIMHKAADLMVVGNPLIRQRELYNGRMHCFPYRIVYEALNAFTASDLRQRIVSSSVIYYFENTAEGGDK